MIVYKYVIPDRIDVLTGQRIRFTQPAALNDPFETLPNFMKVRKDIVDKFLGAYYNKCLANNGNPSPDEFIGLMDRALADWPRRVGADFLFLSLTTQENNLLMWSHYADSHRGFVIGFDSENNFFHPVGGKSLDILREVVYSGERYVMPTSLFSKQASREEMQEIAYRMFFHKSSEWKYEEELRLLAYPSSADETIEARDGFPIHLFDFPPECVQRVILGHLMTSDHKQAISEVVKLKYPHVAVFQSMIDYRKFRLNIVAHPTF